MEQKNPGDLYNKYQSKKKVNYKVGALKRKFGLGKGQVEPGTFIRKSQAQKETTTKEELKGFSDKTKVSVMGLV